GSPPANINAPEFPNIPHDPNNPGFLENFAQANLPDGLYTVRLVDANTGCFSLDTISVQNNQVFPKPVITEIAPVTNCLPLGTPNGVARALVDGTFVGYEFEWFEGTIPAGSPIYVGPEYGELQPDPFTYVVRATNLITGCSDSTVTVISNRPLPVPAPDITILSHMTSCAPVAPNGALSASVGGNIAGYIFNWYDGAVTPPLPAPNFIGPMYDSLDARIYSVSAINRITGCISPVTTAEILPQPEYPDIDFNLVRAICGQNNGSIALIITSDIAINSIVWYNGFDTPNGNEIAGAEGPNLSEALAGDYSVLVTTILGCQSDKDILLDTEIHPYNGISRGSTPGQNDYFHIDCIDNFPQNVVKIFNRAGTLVYEGHGYDNAATLFDGKSNKGVSPMGTNLPDGTYFYVIDKRNGSKPLAGYLEIVE
ncbi:MAG TPA: gliding motility-associated C-terminal domain-containing protein, partial [Saprospiraceae bacterium]